MIFFTDYTSAESQFSSVVPGIKFVCQNLFILLSRFEMISFPSLVELGSVSAWSTGLAEWKTWVGETN